MVIEKDGGVPDPTILFENHDMVVVNKPAGLMVHPDGRTTVPTLVDWVLRTFPLVVGVGEPIILQDGSIIEKPGIVHRLDTDTSGALVLAKTQEAFIHLKDQFKNRHVKKTYVAFVWGEIKDDRITIDRPIGRSGSDFRKWSATRGARGTLRDACTDIRVLQRTKEYTYIEALPKTGRTHQIRVHLKAINHPILCDTQYANSSQCGLGFTRQALHSRVIEIETPSGERVRVEAPLPRDFEEALRIFTKEIA